MDIEKVKQLIELAEEKGLVELEIRDGDTHIRIVREVKPQGVEFVPVPAATSPPKPASSEPSPTNPVTSETVESPAPVRAGLHAIKSPIVGTFYRRPAPDQPPYVEVGDVVEPGQVLCIVEAMKVMNEIPSDIRGRIVEIPVEDAQPVEYGQVLFWIEPL